MPAKSKTAQKSVKSKSVKRSPVKSKSTKSRPVKTAALNPGITLDQVINGAVGPFDSYCMGYMNPGASGDGYIATMKLSVDKVSLEGLDPGTEGIVSYDRCEKDDAYIGQINMGTASSFCGINGALWGYHLAVADAIADNSLQPLFTYPGPDYPPDEKLPTQGIVPVYPVGPLLDAAVRLFGRMDKTGAGETDLRRFPPMPGAHVICANKDASQVGPGYIWSAIAIAIAEDRTQAANLFIEDANFIGPTQGTLPSNPRGSNRRSGRNPSPDQGIMPTPAQVEQDLMDYLHAIAKSMILCGQDQDVTYTQIFAGAKYLFVGENEWGCALTCAPYVVLAQNAVNMFAAPSDLENATITQWEEALGLQPLPPAPVIPGSGGIGVGANG
jgi:histidine decarboxylase